MYQGNLFASTNSTSDTEMCNMITNLLLGLLRLHHALQNFETGVK